jgi:hypothetical protein
MWRNLSVCGYILLHEERMQEEDPNSTFLEHREKRYWLQ